jgi:hypothetical protein
MPAKHYVIHYILFPMPAFLYFKYAMANRHEFKNRYAPAMVIVGSLCALAFFAFGCAPSTKLAETASAQMPDSAGICAPPLPLASVITAPVEIPTAYIRKLINDHIPGLVYETDTLTLPPFKNVELKAWKTDSITLYAKDNELCYSVPLRLWLKIKITVQKFGIAYCQEHEVQASVRVRYRTRFALKSDWSIATTTRSDGYEWISEPVVKVGLLSIPIKPVADRVMAHQQAAFAHIIDEEVRKNLSPRRLAMPAWMILQQPRIISDSLGLWLKLTPHNVAVAPPRGERGAIRSLISVSAVAEAFFGDPPPAVYDTVLPPLDFTTATDSAFTINLCCDLPFRKADSIACGMLIGKTFVYKKQKITVSGIRISSLKGYLVVRAALSGDFKGTAILIGTPLFDPADSTLKAGELEFDISTRNRIHQAADWLRHEKFVEEIRRKIRFPMADKLSQAKGLLQSYMADMRLLSTVAINGTVDSLSVGGIGMSDTSFTVTVFARGKLSVRIAEPAAGAEDEL